MSMRENIQTKLTEAFEPSSLEVIDESHHHQGHSGWRDGGESHFRVKISSHKFAGMNRLARHRAVNEILSDELAGPVHALAIEAKTA